LAVYRNESCIAQFLSPRLILEMKLLPCTDDAASRMVELTAIHAAAGLLRIRQTLGRHYDALQDQQLEIVKARLLGKCHLNVEHLCPEGRRLADASEQIMLAQLWDFSVKLREAIAEPVSGGVGTAIRRQAHPAPHRAADAPGGRFRRGALPPAGSADRAVTRGQRQ